MRYGVRRAQKTRGSEKKGGKVRESITRRYLLLYELIVTREVDSPQYMFSFNSMINECRGGTSGVLSPESRLSRFRSAGRRVNIRRMFDNSETAHEQFELSHIRGLEARAQRDP